MIGGNIQAFPLCCGGQILYGLHAVLADDPRLDIAWLVKNRSIYNPYGYDSAGTPKNTAAIKLPAVCGYGPQVQGGHGHGGESQVVITKTEPTASIFAISNGGQGNLHPHLKESGFEQVFSFDSIHGNGGNNLLIFWIKARANSKLLSLLPALKEVVVDIGTQTSGGTAPSGTVPDPTKPLRTPRVRTKIAA